MMRRSDEIYAHGVGRQMRGVSVWLHRAKMLALFSALGACIGAGVGGWRYWHGLDDAERIVLGMYAQAAFRGGIIPDRRPYDVTGPDGVRYTVYAADILAWDRALAARGQGAAALGRGAAVGVGGGVALALLWGWRARRRGRQLDDEALVRGASVQTPTVMQRRGMDATKKERGPWVTLGGVRIPRAMEARNTLISGTVGAGKTTAIRLILEAATERGEPVICHDPSGDLLASYYEPERGDVILNPFDSRGAYWDPCSEIESPADAAAIAAQLMAPAPGRQVDEWLRTTRGFVADMLGHRARDLREILRILASADREELERLADGTASARIFEPGADRATGSVIFGLVEAVSVLSALRRAPGPGGSFSWRQWAGELGRNNDRAPWVFLGAPERQFERVRPLLAAWLECAAAQLLSLAPSPDRRIWVVVDEFAALPELPAVKRLLSMGRKYGAAVVLGVQSPTQLYESYGRDGAGTIAATAGTQLYLRLPGGEPAQWAARMLGRAEIESRKVTDVMESDELGARSTVTSHREVRDLVLDSELAELTDLTGYLRVPGLGIGRVALEAVRRPAQAPAYVPGDPADLWAASMPRGRTVPGPRDDRDAGDAGLSI